MKQKLQYGLKIALFNFSLETLKQQQKKELLQAPRGGNNAERVYNNLLSEQNAAGGRPSDSAQAAQVQANIATFLYTSAHCYDLRQMEELAKQLETIEWREIDVRHPKFNEVDDDLEFEMGDCDEESGTMVDSINIHQLATNSNNLKSIVTKNKAGQLVELGPPKF